MRDSLSLVSQGQVAYAKNDLIAAGMLFKQALAINPVDTTATVLYALVCARTGKHLAAIEYLRNAIRRDPNLLEAHAVLSQILFAAGQIDEAVFHANRAIEISPDDPELYRNLAMSLSDAGRFAEAAPVWQRYIAADPDAIIGWIGLGRVRLALSEYNEAAECARRALELDGNFADAHMLLALPLSVLGQEAEAELHLRKAIELNPTQPSAHSLIGWLLQERGCFEEAQQFLNESVEVSPTAGIAYYALQRTRRATIEDSQRLSQLNRMASDPRISPLDRAYMRYALGKAEEDLGSYEASMVQFNKANELAGAAWADRLIWDRERYAESFDRTIEMFAPEFFENLGFEPNPSAVPLLVVGMMRSGTTLVEQILSSHPSIAAGGELMFWPDQGSGTMDVDTARLHRDKIPDLARDYLRVLRSISENATHVTDKLPHNYAVLGLVHAAFPNARIIHVRRNALDNCLSIYTTPYGQPPSFAHNKANIVSAYRQYRRIVSHWRHVLPANRILEIDYEELVLNREAETRRMIEFTGLNWNDACLRHEGNNRSVNTPSAWQVRQPIYNSSVNRWHNFEPWLGEFLSLKELLD